MTAPKRSSIVLLLLILSGSIRSQSLVPELVFMNPTLETGSDAAAAGKDGAVYVFANVSQDIDALVKIDGRSSELVSLSEPDIAGPEQDAANGTGIDNAWQPKVTYNNGNAPAHADWWMEFKVSFVKHTDHSQPVSVSQFFVSGLDIDGDGKSLSEYQTYYKQQDFTLNHLAAMTVSSISGSIAGDHMLGKRFNGKRKDYPGISDTATDVMVTNFYQHNSSFVVRLGATTGGLGSKAGNRMYALLFKSFAYDVPENKMLPVILLAFNAKPVRQAVMLDWATTREQNTSHFTLQRSTDGINFDDAAIIFTDGNYARRKKYKFIDHFPMTTPAIIYYRLKEVDMNANFQYSEVVQVNNAPDNGRITTNTNAVASI